MVILPARSGWDAGSPIRLPLRLPPVGAALGRGGVHGLRLGDGFLRPLRVGGLRRGTFSHMRESTQRECLREKMLAGSHFFSLKNPIFTGEPCEC